MTKETGKDNWNRYQELVNTETPGKKTAGNYSSDGMTDLMAKRRISGVDQIGPGNSSKDYEGINLE